MNKLFCTFVRRRELDEAVERITTTYPILYNKIFVLSITDRRDLAITYTPDTTERLPISEDTILVHRKKHTNTLYTIKVFLYRDREIGMMLLIRWVQNLKLLHHQQNQHQNQDQDDNLKAE